MDKPIPQQTQAHPTTMLFVSLYMVVLSFFILLVSLSEREEQKVKEVTEAIQHSFQRILPFDHSFAGSGLIGEERERQDFFESIREGISTHIPLERIRFMESGDFLYIRLPVTELFAPDKTPVRQDRSSLFNQLAELTSRYNKAHQIRFTFYHPSAGNEGEIMRTRLGNIARTFENYGTPTSAITVGAHEGQEDLLIVFHFITEGEKP